jgi:hypothetical protein
MSKTKTVVLASFAALIVSLFTPWIYTSMGDMKVSVGPIVGTETHLGIFLVVLIPCLIAAILGVAAGMKKFPRWLGIVVAIFAVISLAIFTFLFLMSDSEHSKQVSLHVGGWIAFVGMIGTFVAGMMGAIKPYYPSRTA